MDVRLLLSGAVLVGAGVAVWLLVCELLDWADRWYRFRQAQSTIAGDLPAVPTLFGATAVATKVLKRLRRPKEIARMRAALPDLLDQLAQTLRAGLSLHQAILRVEDQPDAALAELLHALNVDLSLGYSVSESLERFQVKVPLPELRMVALALELTSRTGGNIAELLERSASLQRQALQMLRSLRAQTAQGKMSVRLVVAIPLGLVFIMALVMPDYLGSFLSSSLGRGLALLAGALLGIGFAGVRRVVNIEL